MYKGFFPERHVTILPVKFYTSMVMCSVGNAVACAAFFVV
jgi:hypothetical protein